MQAMTIPVQKATGRKVTTQEVQNLDKCLKKTTKN